MMMVTGDKKRSKRTKEEEEEEAPSPSWSWLPDEVALSYMARLSRADLATLAMVSKSHRSLVASPELYRERCLLGFTESCFYVCLRIFPDPSPRWFILTRKRRLRLISTNPYQAPEASSFVVVVDQGIYVIGGLIEGHPTSDVWFLDCLLGTWRQVRSMKLPRASPSASLVDGKIYVFGRCHEECGDSSNWAEVFDMKTQTWGNLSKMMPFDIHHSVVIEGKRIYAVDEEHQSFYFTPNECMFWRTGKIDKPGNRDDWCAIGDMLYSRGTRGRIFWCEPGEFDWKEVKGLAKLQQSLSGSRLFYHFHPNRCGEFYAEPTDVKYDISALSTNSAGNLVVFWKVQLEKPERLQLWCAEISLERRREGDDEIWGNVEWSGAVYQLDPRLLSYNVNFLYSASVHV